MAQGFGKAVLDIFKRPPARGTVDQGIKLLQTPRGNLLQSTKNPELRRAIKELYRKTAIVGDGGTADVIRFERATGILMSPKGHVIKGRQSIAWLQNIIRNENLSAFDSQVAKYLIDDLVNAAKGL